MKKVYRKIVRASETLSMYLALVFWACDLSAGAIHRPHPGVIGQWIKPVNFAPNAVGTYGNIGKNSLRSPGSFNTDLSAIQNTKLGERVSLQLRADIFNVTNHPNFGAPNNVQNSPGFGQIGGTQGSGAYGGPTSYGTSQPRTMQFGVKATF